MLYKKKKLFLLMLVIASISSCRKDEVAGTRITQISGDISLYDDKTYIIDSDIPNIHGSINIGGNAVLKIINATLNFELNEDLDYGIYLEDSASIIIENSTLTSEDKMWEFELRGNATIEVNNSSLENHSAVKLFDNCRLDAKNSLIEELRMDNYGIANLNNCEIYPNMQFFFNVPAPLEFPQPYQDVDFTLNNPDAWQLNMVHSKAQGWQCDIYPGTNITIQNSTDINLGLRSNGQMNDTIDIANP
ncbi:MAG: hypothetical protein V1904_12825, partial [Bacteroidota bacterium]